MRVNGRDVWQLHASGVHVGATGGHAHREAQASFSATGQLVHSNTDGWFEFDADDRVTRHRDCFHFQSW